MKSGGEANTTFNLGSSVTAITNYAYSLFGSASSVASQESKQSTPAETKHSPIEIFKLGKLIKFGDTCKTYTKENGETPWSQYEFVNYLASFVVKTNQPSNKTLYDIVQEAKNNEMNHEAVRVCGALIKINEHHKTIIDARKEGRTSNEIERLMQDYQLPTNNEECRVELEKITHILLNITRNYNPG